MNQFKIIVEKHSDGYVAYPLGVKGIVVGEGNTYEEALADVKSAIKFYIDSFGKEVFKLDYPSVYWNQPTPFFTVFLETNEWFTYDFFPNF